MVAQLIFEVNINVKFRISIPLLSTIL